jgi:excisionase family DNA binding protein
MMRLWSSWRARSGELSIGSGCISRRAYRRGVDAQVIERRPPEIAIDRLLTADELATRWQVPKAQVYRLSREGRLPTVRIGRYYRYALKAVTAFEAAGGVRADA